MPTTTWDTDHRVPTGEPCRCPEHVLHCECGAYAEADTWSSASRQHYIDTGHYLLTGEAVSS